MILVHRNVIAVYRSGCACLGDEWELYSVMVKDIRGCLMDLGNIFTNNKHMLLGWLHCSSLHVLRKARHNLLDVIILCDDYYVFLAIINTHTQVVERLYLC